MNIGSILAGRPAVCGAGFGLPTESARKLLNPRVPMRRFSVFACWLALSLNLAAAPLTVVTWNTKWLPGGRPNASEGMKQSQMKKAQAIVKAINPDVLLLQEVADWKAAAELCSVVPGLTVRTVSDFSTRPQNLVVASKIPADSSWWAAFKPTLGENLPPRGYAFSALELPGKQGFLLTYSVHFKSNLGGVEANIEPRQEASKQLLAHIDAMTKLYGQRGKVAVLVGGDFNSDPGDPKFWADRTTALLWNAGLDWSWKGVPHAEAVTIPASKYFPAGTFDHLFTRGLKLLSVKAPDGSASSDHNPVVAVFR